MSSVSSSNGAHVLLFESPETAQAAAETHNSSARLRFNSMTLDQLSDELDRRTKETQRLQEEVETAAQVALERFGCKYGINTSPGQSCHNRWFNVYNPPGDFTIFPTHTQAVTHQEVVERQISSPGERVLENAVDDGFQQLPGFQLRKTHDQTEQAIFSVDKAIGNLQTKLHEVQMEKAALSDLRLKDSKNHVDQMEKMLCMLEELQNIKRAADQKLQDTEDEALALSRKVETLEQIMKETYSTLLSHESECGNNYVTDLTRTRSTQPPPAAKLTEERNDTNKLHERCLMSIEHPGSEEHTGGNSQKQRSEELIASLCQEMALLTDKLSSSKHSSLSLSVKLELLKNLVESQTSLHQCRFREFNPDISSHKDKVYFLEQQLLQVQSQLADVQGEKERSLQQREELQFQLSHFKWCREQQQSEIQVEVKALRGGLEEAREQLHRVRGERNCLQALQDERTQEGRKAQELLREKEEELRLRLHEAQQQHSWCQNLHIEAETLRLKLDEREKLINILRLQLESSVHMKAQHSHAIDSLLSSQRNLHQPEIQQLRAELDQHKSDLATAEHERRHLQASVAEQSQRVREETLEKRQLTAQLEIQRMQILTLTKEHEELQRLHSCKSDEQEGVVLSLRSQLRDTHDELDQVRITLRTLEGADGHGLRAALDMQKEITARREQVDSLQGKIQHLEETVEKLHQEKRRQGPENQRRLGELICVREEKKQLSNEMEVLRSKDQQLRGRISHLEAILHKMSESFADCQDFIQLQDQQFYRLKLRHALDLKELQGQNLHTTLNPTPPDLDSPNPSALGAPPSSQHVSNSQIKVSPARQLRSPVKEPRGVISEKHRPHTDDSPAGRSFHRRRSAPGREHRTTFSTDEAEDIKANSRLRRKTCSSEPLFLTKAELNGKTSNQDSFSERIAVHPGLRHTSSPPLLSLGRRSPVHTLLTSDPHS